MIKGNNRINIFLHFLVLDCHENVWQQQEKYLAQVCLPSHLNRSIPWPCGEKAQTALDGAKFWLQQIPSSLMSLSRLEHCSRAGVWWVFQLLKFKQFSLIGQTQFNRVKNQLPGIMRQFFIKSLPSTRASSAYSCHVIGNSYTSTIFLDASSFWRPKSDAFTSQVYFVPGRYLLRILWVISSVSVSNSIDGYKEFFY